MVNVVSRANQNVYTYMVNEQKVHTWTKCLYLYGECCEQSKSVHTWTKCLYLYGECCEQSKSVHTWTKCLYLYGECCEESNYQNVYTYMVNVVRRAMIKMFLLIW